MHKIFSLAELDFVAAEIAEIAIKKKIIALHGEMGAGKTTLVSAICRALGSNDTVGSPTYAIINQYKTANGADIFHMDWYRLKDEEEAVQAGVEDALYSSNICLVEWPERAPGVLPAGTLHLYLEAVEQETRRISTTNG